MVRFGHALNSYLEDRPLIPIRPDIAPIYFFVRKRSFQDFQWKYITDKIQQHD
jgi:hypothetical protein